MNDATKTDALNAIRARLCEIDRHAAYWMAMVQLENARGWVAFANGDAAEVDACKTRMRHAAQRLQRDVVDRIGAEVLPALSALESAHREPL